MIISKVEFCKKNKQRVNVYIDDEFAFAIFYDLLYENSLSKGMDITKEKIDELKKADMRLLSNRCAFDILAKRSISNGLLIERLVKKGIDLEFAENTAKYMQKKGYIDDVNYARNKAKYLQSSKKYGCERIKIALYNDKIDKEIVNIIVRELDENISIDNLQNILKTLVLKTDMSDFKDKQKMVMKLVRKGYSFDEIKIAIEKYNSEEENLE